MEQTKKQRFFEIIRFLLVGGLSTILDYATTYGLGLLLAGFWFNAAVSNTVGHIVGLLVNFFLSVIFVYKQVKNKEENALENYMSLLKAGGSDYPVEIIKKAGVDLTDKESFMAVVRRIEFLVNELEKLLGE